MLAIGRFEAALLGSLAVSTASTFLSWGVSGSIGRNSYELVSSARTLEVLDGPLVQLAPIWFFLPILAASAVVAVARRRPILGALISITIGIVMLLGWMTVKSAPLAVDTGATAGAISGGATIAAAGALLWRQGTRREPQSPDQPRRELIDV